MTHRRISRRDLVTGASAAGVASVLGAQGAAAQPTRPPRRWDRETDVVVIGAGATGFPAAIVARESGADVILLEAETHIGGHAICSGGNLPLGGGTSVQKEVRHRGLTRYRVPRSDRLVDRAGERRLGLPLQRQGDRARVRRPLHRHVRVARRARRRVHGQGARRLGRQLDRQLRAARDASAELGLSARADGRTRGARAAHDVDVGQRFDPAARSGGEECRRAAPDRASHDGGLSRRSGRETRRRRRGRCAERRAQHPRAQGRRHRDGRVDGQRELPRIFDPRLTEEYCGLAGMPYSNQDASGELAALAVGASLWGTYNQSGEFGEYLTKPGLIGAQYGYRNLRWMPGAPVFDKVHATGLPVGDWQDVVLVNMLGQRFYDETAGNYTANSYRRVDPYTPNSYLNSRKTEFEPNGFIAAALAGIGDGHNGGGPIWAVFDADAVAREEWTPVPPNVDMERGFFFSAGTLADLAREIVMPHQRVPMPPENLVATIERFNSFVDSGVDADFGRPKPTYKIAKPPFYAAWATPVIHDTRAGLRINARCQVVDMSGTVIAGLYCGGESAGGFSMHGLARCMCQGYIAGTHAAAESGTT